MKGLYCERYERVLSAQFAFRSTRRYAEIAN